MPDDRRVAIRHRQSWCLCRPLSGLGVVLGRVGIAGADAARPGTRAPFGAGKGLSTKVRQAVKPDLRGWWIAIHSLAAWF